MFKKAILVFGAAAVLYSCGNSNIQEEKELNADDFKASISTMEQSLFDKNHKMFNDSMAAAVIIAYEKYASLYPEDPLTPDYLFKAGEVSLGLGRAFNSISFFKKVYEKYPDYEKASHCLFLQAYVLDNHLNDDVNAGEIYNLFIQKFPGHPLARDAEFSIQHLGKSDEDLIKEFEEKSKNNI
jgi:TolA-binding protein